MSKKKCIYDPSKEKPETKSSKQKQQKKRINVLKKKA